MKTFIIEQNIITLQCIYINKIGEVNLGQVMI